MVGYRKIGTNKLNKCILEKFGTELELPTSLSEVANTKKDNVS